MSELEALGQPYLFKLRQSQGVKRLIERQWGRCEWADAGQGWQACEDTLRLTGWTQSRRVVVMRRVQKRSVVVEKSGKDKRQTELFFIDENEPVKVWEYAVLVCNTAYPLSTLGQLYRDRADCENGFDELKNQWGWGGYSTRDIERCDVSAKMVALVYNWWSWYTRLAHPKARMEAITSRPKLLAGVGRVTQHGGQTRVLLTLTHAAAARIKSLVSNVREGLQYVRGLAPQMEIGHYWQALVRYIVDKIMDEKRPNPNASPVLMSG